MKREKIVRLFSGLCCSVCKCDFEKDSLFIKREDKNLLVIQVVCQNCGKSFGLALLGANGFEIKETEDTENVYLIKDGTLFLLYGRKDFEKMTSRKYEYIKGLNGHFEIALYVDTFEEVDRAYEKAISKGAKSVLPPENEPWGQRTCYIADPENNLIEIGSFNRPFDERN